MEKTMHSVKVNITRTEEFMLSPKEALKVTIDVLRKVFDFDKDYFIEDGKVKKTTTYHTSHSWEKVDEVREATELDVHIYYIIKTLNTAIRKAHTNDG